VQASHALSARIASVAAHPLLHARRAGLSARRKAAPPPAHPATLATSELLWAHDTTRMGVVRVHAPAHPGPSAARVVQQRREYRARVARFA
jgi:hypothetical protein